ncbi:MAG: IdeS/Mac family cysteine endopeptidase [Candidatus Saccharibacteria bacterium]|nr:IdeS/Mac family cysteine endopeptidase [Candidatus Saccharibacteria bacterium]
MQKKYKTLIVLLLLLMMSSAIVFGYQRLTQTTPEQPTPQTKSPPRQSSRDTGKIESSPQDANVPETDHSPEVTETDDRVALHDGAGQSQRSDATQRPSTASPHASAPHTSPVNPGAPSQPPVTQPTPPTQPPVVPPTPPTPPVVPPTPPVQPPVTPPVQPPTPPTPPVTPPQPPLTDEEKARKILNDLKSPANQNVAQFTNDDGQIRTVLWTKGITGPRLGAGGDFVKHDETHGGTRYVTYSAAYRPEFTQHGWYDADKAHGSSPVDINLCFGSVAANQLHWWMHNNRDYVTRFLAKTNYAAQLPPAQHGTLKDLRTFQNSFAGQQNSRFFSMMKVYFGSNREGYYADPLVDMFINGHKPKPGGAFNDPDWQHGFQMDSRGGFFHDVFKKRNLTRRMTMSDFKDFATEMKKAFQTGESVGVIHHTSAQNTHIVTAWGLEYDLDGTLVAIYVTDSDDQDSPHNGMKRYGVRSIGNKPHLSNNLSNPNSGAKIDQISTLGLGEDKWEEYLK